MPLSMTGYGNSLIEDRLYSVNVEIRSVNHRFLDINIRLPKNYLWLEENCGRLIRSLAQRGKIDCFIQIQPQAETKTQMVCYNRELLRDYLKCFREIKRLFRLPGRIRTEHLLGLPELFFYMEPAENRGVIEKLTLEALQEAIRKLLKMRAEEGRTISADFITRLESLEKQISEIEEISYKLPMLYREKLTTYMNNMLKDVEIDENRIANEALLYIERSSIDEEIVRFKSHLSQFALTLKQEGPIGRKLDFITQELNREINTIASKATDLTISHQVVEVKTGIEKIREQVQNIE